MRVLLYDSAYHSSEGDYCGRSILWGLNAANNLPVCINVVGHPAEAYLELPPVACGRSIDWGSSTGTTIIVRNAIIRTISAAISDAGDDDCSSVKVESRFGLMGYRESQSYYLHVKCEKRETLDTVIHKTKAVLTNQFSGSTPVWRETEIDPVTKMFAALKWHRSGWYELPDSYDDIKEPLCDVTVRGLDGKCLRWIDAEIKTKRPVTHLYLHINKMRHITDPSELEHLSASPTALFFDFEAYRGSLEGFPDAAIPSDLVYMCSVVVATLGSERETRQKYCISVGTPDLALLDGVTVLPVDSEHALYNKLAEIIAYENPEIISGYNIHGFDLKYMEKRLALWGADLPDISRLPGKRSGFDLLRGPRGSRYTNLKCPGRIVMDLFLYLIKNTSRQELASFNLKNVANYYLFPPVERGAPKATLTIEMKGGTWTASVAGWSGEDELSLDSGDDDGWTEKITGIGHIATLSGKGEDWLNESLKLVLRARPTDAPPGIHIKVLTSTDMDANALFNRGSALDTWKMAEPWTIECISPKSTTTWKLPETNVNAGKIDLKYKDQFILYLRYLLGFPDGPAGLGRIAEYCVRDSDILPDLFENRAIWGATMQFSNLLGCTMQTVMVAGQVERLSPMLYRFVRARDTVMEINPDAGKFQYEGGYVHLTSPGRHANVCIGDFASLYPSLIISLNLCWTTRVPERSTMEIVRTKEPSQYHITNISYKVEGNGNCSTGKDHQYDPLEDEPEADIAGPDTDDDEDEDEDADPDANADANINADIDRIVGSVPPEVRKAIRKAKHTMAHTDNYADRNENLMYVGPSIKLGIVPEALKILLDERTHIRKVIRPEFLDKAKAARIAGDIAGARRFDQLADDADKRQLAIKEAANSTYGFMGAPAPYACPFIAMTTTSEGRSVIKKSTDLILQEKPETRKHVYSDTDSSMIHDSSFSSLPTRPLREAASLRIEDLGCDPRSLPDWCLAGYRQLLADWGRTRTRLERDCIIPVIEETCEHVCAIPDRSGIYTSPMKFEYEAFVISGMWFAKKFYIARILDDERKIKLKQRGILLRRGDYPEIVKKIYGAACFGLLDGHSIQTVSLGLVKGIERIFQSDTLTFAECSISTDFKSLAEYKEPTCKMAVLARHADALGVPIQENSRVDCIMVEPPNQTHACDSIMVRAGGNSENLATRDMFEILDRRPDRDHYFKVLVSHVDKLYDCVLANYRNDMVYIFDTARAFEYCNQLSYDYLQTPLRLTRNQCSACSRLMSYHVGGPYATIENGPLRMLQCCVTCSGGTPPGSVPLTSLTCFTWNFTSPLKSLMSIYTSVLRGSPDAQLQFIRGWIVNFFRELVNRLNWD